ncbi:hypothetical protein BJX66DRAFT_302078 [Aspergillus keveii]|uniref:C2H2-type domain-containing protein n=1 Tax=Aspergillus keveii TaxID=714993 RepID=A0ABR4G8Y3_9EURO
MSKGLPAAGATQSGDPSFYCHTCQRRFVNADALHMHCQSSKAHREKGSAQSPSAATVPRPKAPSAAPVYMCNLCDKRFKDRAALQNHRNDSPKHRTLPSATQDGASSGTKAPGTRLSHDKTTQALPGPCSPLLGEKNTIRQPTYLRPKTTWPRTSLGSLAQFTSFVKESPDICIGLATASAAQRVAYDSSADKGQRLKLYAAERDCDIPVALESTEHSGREANHESVPLILRGPAPWSSVASSERDAVLSTLQAQCHSIERLAEEHNWTAKPSALDIDMTRKCNNCGASKRKMSTDPTESVCRFHPAKKAFERGIIRGRGSGVPKTARCVNCPKLGPSGGCIVLPAHDFAPANAKLSQMALVPVYNPNAREALVLDCEMVGVLDANHRETSEVVRVSAVDFLSGEVLIDTYVSPQGHVVSWRTKFSGVDAAILREKKREGKVISGWRAARTLLWSFIDAQTILIGHSLNNDLAVLGMVHTRVVDSAIMTRLAVGEDCQRHWALKILGKQFLDRDIQTGNDGHDCLEDTYAAREVVLWCLRNPFKLQAWAADERELIAEKKRGKEAALAEANGTMSAS